MAAPLLFLVVLVSVSFAAATRNATRTVYVQPENGDCPANQECQFLSNIIQQQLFTKNLDLVFLEGEHNFNQTRVVQVKNVDYFSLRGAGQWIKGPEETVMQSSVIVNCTKGRPAGFLFTDSTKVIVKGLTFINCAHYYNSYTTISFDNIANLTFTQVSIQNSPGNGLTTFNCRSVLIQNSSFAYSNYLPVKAANDKCKYDHFETSSLWGNAAFVYIHTIDVQLVVEYSNFTKGCSKPPTRSIGGGGINVYFDNSVAGSVDLNGLILTQNIGGSITLNIKNAKLQYLLRNTKIVQAAESDGFYLDAIDGLLPESNNIVSIKSNISLHNISFQNNSLHIKGDCAYPVMLLAVSDSRTQSMMYINLNCYKSTTLQNIVQTTGSNFQPGFGVSIYSDKQLDLNLTYHEFQYHILFKDCYFYGNQYGSSLMKFQGVSATFQNCSFVNNTGGVAVILTVTSDSDSPTTALHSASYLQRLVFENSTMSDNKMTGITAVNSEVLFRGYNTIQKHQSGRGAALQLLNGSYCIINGTLDLTDNQATDIGGALYSNSTPSHNKHCTLNFFEDSELVFSGNRALRGGSDIYGATLFNCTTSNNTNTYFIPFAGSLNQTSRYFQTSLLKHIQFNNTDPLSSMTSYPIMICFCNSSYQPVCSYKSSKHIESYPGAYVYASIATVGYYGGTSPGTVIFKASEVILLEPKCSLATNLNCSTVHISLEKSSSALASIEMRVDGGLPGWEATLSIKFIDCPVGFPLDEHAKACQCAKVLRDFNVTCDINTQEFTRSGNKWIAFLNFSACMITYNNCPFDYCNTSSVSFDLKESGSDYQCANNRTGILCGQCKQGLSLMLGSNNCATCSNIYLLMLVPIAIAGFVLIAVMMTLNLTVSVGAINGLLFYANMVKLNEAFFFPNGNIPVISQFISWLNLDLGIDVCFIDGLDGYWKTWLQFAFPAYLYIIIGIIIVGSRYSKILSKLCGNQSVPVLATLFLMSYTKVLRTVTNALSMARLECNDSIITVWNFDGNIPYGSTKHIPLVIFSSCILLLTVFYPILLLFAPLLQKFSGRCFSKRDPVNKLKPLLDAYGGPYKDSCRSWTGVTLIVRLIVTVTFSFTLGNLELLNCFVITTISVGILSLWVPIKGVYKTPVMNALDMFYIFNLALLSNFSLSAAKIGRLYVEITSISSVSLSIFIFIIICILQLKWKLKGNSQSISFNAENTLNDPSDLNSNIERIREPLLFDE